MRMKSSAHWIVRVTCSCGGLLGGVLWARYLDRVPGATVDLVVREALWSEESGPCRRCGTPLPPLDSDVVRHGVERWLAGEPSPGSPLGRFSVPVPVRLRRT
jgi:hypothetical protein